MATNVYVDLFKVVVARITAAMSSGKKLNGIIKSFVIGGRASVKEPIDKPSLTLRTGDPFIDENYTAQSSRNKSGEVIMELELLYPITNGLQDNLYYSSTTPPSGILPTIEIILDVLSESVSQVIAAQMGQNSRKSIKISVGAITKLSDATMRCLIGLGFDMNDFSINGRNVA